MSKSTTQSQTVKAVKACIIILTVMACIHSATCVFLALGREMVGHGFLRPGGSVIPVMIVDNKLQS